MGRETNQVLMTVEAFKDRVQKMPIYSEAKEVSREEFTLLLSGIASCRKIPGISRHMGYETLYHCKEQSDRAAASEFLESMYGITDKTSLLQACHREYNVSGQYEQFMTFWHKVPLFELSELNERGRAWFERCQMAAQLFYPLLKEKGFYAWDINERIGLCRVAVACGLLTEEEFWQVTDSWVKQALVFYNSYGEYAVSCLCGALYYMGRYEADIESFLEINLNMIEHLLEEGGAWQRNSWYKPKEREWASLVADNRGCLVTKRALDEEKIGYMYREEPNKEYPDSGWRFFVGDEEDDYISDPDNITVCSLNTICNLNPEVMAYMHVEEGRRFGRYAEGWREE